MTFVRFQTRCRIWNTFRHPHPRLLRAMSQAMQVGHPELSLIPTLSLTVHPILGNSLSPAGVNRTSSIPIDVHGHKSAMQSSKSLVSSSDTSETWDPVCCDQPLPNLSLGPRDISPASTGKYEHTVRVLDCECLLTKADR